MGELSVTPRVTASTPFESWPLWLTVRELAILTGRAEKSLRSRTVSQIWPPPVADADGFIRPYRFDKAVVARYMAGRLPRPRRRTYPRRIGGIA
jgi:hypothetical protein